MDSNSPIQEMISVDFDVLEQLQDFADALSREKESPVTLNETIAWLLAERLSRQRRHKKPVDRDFGAFSLDAIAIIGFFNNGEIRQLLTEKSSEDAILQTIIDKEEHLRVLDEVIRLLERKQ